MLSRKSSISRRDDPAARGAGELENWLASGECRYPGREFGLPHAQDVDDSARL
jgi:hypothetical protein